MKRIVISSIVLLVLAAGVLSYVSRSTTQAQSGAQIILYWGENFTGRSVTVTDTVFDLPVLAGENGAADVNWNDEVRSIEVTQGTWRLYQHGRANTKLDHTDIASFDVTQKEAAGGWSCLLSATSSGPLRIPNPAAGGFWRDISSIELVSNQNLPDWAMDLRK